MNAFITAIVPYLKHRLVDGEYALSIAVPAYSNVYAEIMAAKMEKWWQIEGHVEVVRYVVGRQEGSLLIGPEHWGDWTRGTMLEVEGELINVLYHMLKPKVVVRRSKKIVAPRVPME